MIRTMKYKIIKNEYKILELYFFKYFGLYIVITYTIDNIYDQFQRFYSNKKLAYHIYPLSFDLPKKNIIIIDLYKRIIY